MNSIFDPPRYVTKYETFPTGGEKHTCEPGHCSQNPLFKPVKGCYLCKKYSEGLTPFGERPYCGHFDYLITPAEGK